MIRYARRGALSRRTTARATQPGTGTGSGREPSNHPNVGFRRGVPARALAGSAQTVPQRGFPNSRKANSLTSPRRSQGPAGALFLGAPQGSQAEPTSPCHGQPPPEQHSAPASVNRLITNQRLQATGWGSGRLPDRQGWLSRRTAHLKPSGGFSHGNT